MNQFIEKQQFVVLTPISIGLDSLDIEQEIPYLTEGDIERKSLLPVGNTPVSKDNRTTQALEGKTKRLKMKVSQQQAQMEELKQLNSSQVLKQTSSYGYIQAYDMVSIKAGVKVWGKFMPNGSVYLLNSFQGTDFFCSIGAAEVSEKLLSLESSESEF